MKHLKFVTVSIALILILLSSAAATAQDIKLPPPETEGGMPLMEALKERKTMRTYSSRELPDQMLSNLLWAAWGENRSDGRRTAPSASNRQEIDVYVATTKGCYLYDAQENMLKRNLAEDIRSYTGMQAFVNDAPINLVFVADLSKMGGGSDDAKEKTAYVDTGYISQNVYLFCASEGLATVARGMVDKDALAKKMNLGANQRVILAQTVGYPK